ncbi:MAG: pyrroline-5-carboxylate reductase [Myxococcota bacterium]|nr:pyrroline-5-carboxylate reductase [Myxococcota bacterium]
MTHPLETHRIGFIGCGAMARALAGGLRAAGVAPERLGGADLSAEQRSGFEASVGARTFSDNADLLAQSDVLVLSVKPGVVAPVLEGLADTPELGRPLWISIAAGIRISALEKALPDGARVIRTMPNTPALVGAGASVLCPNSAASEDDLGLAEALFAAVGTTWRAPEEGLMDAVTGLSGSGPAYLFLFLEALADAGTQQGLPREAALQLARQTAFGAAKLALEDSRDPAELRAQVSSPGGTTLAGLAQLDQGDLRGALGRAVAAATARSRELSGDD